jgi:hypothetical protein
MPSLLIEWGVWAAKTNHRSQAAGAHGMALFAQLTALNTGWYIASQYGFGPADGAYETIVWTLTLTVGLTIAASALGTLAAFGRIVTGTTDHQHFDLVRANAWVMHAVMVGAVIAYWLIWYVK